MTAGSKGNEGSAAGSGIEFPPAAATVVASWTTCIGFAEATGVLFSFFFGSIFSRGVDCRLGAAVFFRTGFVFRIGFRFAATVFFDATLCFGVGFRLGVAVFFRTGFSFRIGFRFAATVFFDATLCFGVGFRLGVAVFFRTGFSFRIGFRFAATVLFGASFRFSADFLLGVVFFLRFFRATAFFATRDGFVWRRAVVRSDPEVRFAFVRLSFLPAWRCFDLSDRLPDLRVDFAIQEPSRS